MRTRGVPLRGLPRRLRVLLVGCSLAVAGLGVLSAADGHGDAGSGRSASAVAEVDRAAAVAEAHRLVRLVRPPAGSHLLIPDAPVKGALTLGPPDTYLVGAGKTWTVSLSSAQAVAWLKSYDPPGFARDGVVLDNAPGTVASNMGLWGPNWPGRGQLQSAQRGFSDIRPSRIWSSARLSMWLLPIQSPRELQLEVSAEVTLRGQDPKRDDRAGPRVHVAADRPCPEDLGGAIGVLNPEQPELDRMLVPRGAPSGGRLCYYGEYGIDHGEAVGGPSRLQSELVLDQAAAARLAGIARTVQLGYSDYTGPYGGLAGGPGAAVLALAYPGRPEVDLWSYNEGSGMVANGHIKADGIPFTDSGFSYVLGDLERPAPAATREPSPIGRDAATPVTAR